MIKKILLAPFNLLKNLLNLIINFIKKPKEKNKNKFLNSYDYEEIARYWLDNYNDKIQFKLNLNDLNNELIIYTSNFKTTLERTKKREKKENEDKTSNSIDE